jgi:SAM-dependent methyltransferase
MPAMKLLDLVRRPVMCAPWDEGDNIPWNDPDFSKRMLKEHLSQAHDAASRRIEKIEEQVNWIHHKVLLGRPTQILELGCGPGLYTSRLARRGHTCVGIDYSPASIAYAADCAGQEDLHCTYRRQDIRQAEYGAGFGLVMLIYGELNVFRPADARNILDKANLSPVMGCCYSSRTLLRPSARLENSPLFGIRLRAASFPTALTFV